MFHRCAQIFGAASSLGAGFIVGETLEMDAGSVGYVVLDEADKMLSLGFKIQLDQIWASITGSQKDATSETPIQRPQVPLLQASKLHF